MFKGVDDGLRPFVAFLREGLDLCTSGGHDGELTGDEEGVSGKQQDQQCDGYPVVHARTPFFGAVSS